MITALLPLLASCSSQINPETINALIKTESGYNPNAIALIKGSVNLDTSDKLKSALLIGKAIKSGVINPSVSIGYDDQSHRVNSLNQLINAFDNHHDISKISVSWASRSIMLTDRKKASDVIGILDNLHANYSVGLGQINRDNFSGYNVSGTQLLDPCTNLKVSQEILKKCYIASPNHKVSEALSCYYAGNYSFGFKQESGLKSSYTQRVASNFVPENQIVVPSIGNELNYIKRRNSVGSPVEKTQDSNQGIAVKQEAMQEEKSKAVVKNGRIYDTKMGVNTDVLANNENANKRIF